MTALLPNDPLDPDQIMAALGNEANRFQVQVFAQCASTNRVLLESPPPADGRIAVVTSEVQTAGRGRRGRDWLSWPQAGLTFSLLWHFPAGEGLPAGLSLATGLAVATALEDLGAQGIRLKWPNDLLATTPQGLGKLGGILIELLPDASAAVIGIGLNLSLPDGIDIPGQSHVTDLASHCPGLPGRNVLLAQLLRRLDQTLGLCTAAGFAPLRPAWQQRHAYQQQPVRLEDGDTSTYGECLGVDDTGALLLRSGNRIQRILSGDLCSLRPQDPCDSASA